MTASVFPAECADSIGFSRLHALVGRGYRPQLGMRRGDDGHVCIPFSHPRDGQTRNPPPRITLWSDGIVSTAGLLWPDKYVPSDDPPPDWQQYILPQDEKRFETFVASVERPGMIDLFLKPLLSHLRIFSVRMTFGATLCMLIGFGGKLVLAQI